MMDKEKRIDLLLNYLYEVRCLYENTLDKKYLNSIEKIMVEIELVLLG